MSTSEDYGLGLLPQHAERLAASRVAPDVAHERGYRSADNAAQVQRHGFENATTGWLPGLIIPWWSVGAIELHQYRPDHPFGSDNGDGVRYVFPAGARVGLDVHPRLANAEVLDDPSIPLWITEGIFKVDAILSAGAYALGLSGVWGWRYRTEDDEVHVIEDLDLVVWEGRTAYLAFDADAATNPSVWKALSGLWRELRRRGASPWYVRVPLVKADGHTGIDDYLASLPNYEASELLDDLADNATDELPDKPTGGPPPVVSERPTVDVGGSRPVIEIASEMIGHLARSPSRKHEVYFHGGGLTTLDVSEDRPLLAPVDTDRLSWLVGHACDPVRLGRDGNVRQHVPVPRHLAGMILSLGGEGPWPHLEGITATPYLRPDGTIVSTPGYDWPTRYLYRPLPGFDFPSVPAAPTDEHVRSALDVIDDVLSDFGLHAPHDRAHAIALVLTPFVRPIVDLVPMFVVESTTPGAGKGLLVQAVSTIATGQAPGTWPYPSDPEEGRKLITAILRGGVPLVMLDEARSVGGAHFANLLTSPLWHDRILGSTATLDLPNRSVWCAVGNNVEIRGDLARRVVLVKLDPRSEHPEQRPGSSFRHHPLLAFLIRERGRIVCAALTLLAAWVAAGKPSGPKSLGSYEEWSSAVGGTLALVGVDGFLDDRDLIHEHADVERVQWSAFLTWLRDRYGDEPWTVAEVVRTVRAAELETPDSLGAVEHADYSKRLGHQLRQRRGRRFGGLELVEAGRDGATMRARWIVRSLVEEWPW